MACRIGVLGVLLLLQPLRAEKAGPDYRGLQGRGESQVRTGNLLIGSGLALLPLSALALIPVLHDGAFGITAADPGIAGGLAAVGGGLIHAGIPLVGFGSENLERAAYRLEAGAPGGAAAGWSHYRRGWNLMAGGSTALLVSLPFVVVAALDLEREREWVHYLSMGLVGGGLGLMAAGILEQHYSLYRFAATARDARKQLRAYPLVSLVPDLRWDRSGRPRAGMRLVGSF